MKTIGTDVLYFETGPDNEPVAQVKPGEEFEIRTQMNRGPWIDDEPEAEALRQRLYGGNPSSGCVYVEGAEAGALLSVHIHDIALDDVGFTRFAGANGAVPSWFGDGPLGELYKKVRIKDGEILWSKVLRIPARPMIGFVGTAPELERHHNGWAGYWGGNFDVQEITTGATVHLPVMVDGALLHVGDMHAVQGDGEICGAGGIETSGIVRLSCTVNERPQNFRNPRIENPTHLISVAFARPAEDAFRTALEDLVLWLSEDHGLAPGDAFMLLAQVMESRCTQFVNPTFTYVTKIAKRFLRAG